MNMTDGDWHTCLFNLVKNYYGIRFIVLAFGSFSGTKVLHLVFKEPQQQ
jgi:hypothetical protein